jgi:hypothetical protein
MTVEIGTRRPSWAGLAEKLFASYLLVVMIGIGVLVLAASHAAPSFFDLRMAQMMGNTAAGRAPGVGMMAAPQMSNQFDLALADSFRASLGQGLPVAGAAAFGLSRRARTRAPRSPLHYRWRHDRLLLKRIPP